MFRLVLAILFLFTIEQSQAQAEVFPIGDELKAGKIQRSFTFSRKTLDSKRSSKELQIIDTLLQGNCFLAKIKHKSGDYALLRKRGKRFELQYLVFSSFSAKPYFVNDSIDMNRDKRNEVIIYWSATLNAYQGYKTYEGTKTGLLIVDPLKRNLIVSCDLTSCGAGVKEGSSTPEGLCHYQYGLSFMPMSVVVTTYKKMGSAAETKPGIKQYNLKKKKFLLMQALK